MLLYVHSSFAIIFTGKRELVALLRLSSWCVVIAVLLFLAVPLVCLQFVIVVFPDHTQLLFISFASFLLKQIKELLRSYSRFIWCMQNYNNFCLERERERERER